MEIWHLNMDAINNKALKNQNKLNNNDSRIKD